jgi:hypothetical protein
LEESKVDKSAVRKEVLKQARIKRARGEALYLCPHLPLIHFPPSPTARAQQTPQDRELLDGGASAEVLLLLLEGKMMPEEEYRK